MSELEELRRELAASVRFEIPENAQRLGGKGAEFQVVWWQPAEPGAGASGSTIPSGEA